MRNASFHRLLSRFALAAMLLLATLPTLGRLTIAAHPPSHAMSTPHGHVTPARRGAGDPLQPEHAHAQDCTYCALLAGTMPTTVLAPVVPGAPATRLASMHRSTPVPSRASGSGLGARGPPRNA